MMATGSNDKEAIMDEENKSDNKAEEIFNMLKLEKMKTKHLLLRQCGKHWVY